ncbi:MAG: hypothetical protein M3082_15020 [Candidatus Dormibacteraeota bacterium]|nr:hypothetical protein [Candidatus Dormibacteraeota bacterium]
MIEEPAPPPEPSGELLAPPAPVVAPTPRLGFPVLPIGAPAGNRRRLWAALLAVAVLVTGGGLAFLYNDDRNLQSQVGSLTTDKHALQGQVSGLQGQVTGLQGQLTATQGNLTTAQSDLASARAQLAHPSLGIWNVAQSLQGPTYYLAAGIPDTFTYHLKLKSTAAINVSIISFDQFSAAVKCIENGAGVTNWCMHHSGAANSWLGGTSVTFDFHLAEGCAAYMVVITAPAKAVVTPDVSVTYNPANHATGTCS